jgi:hypothetical protein
MDFKWSEHQIGVGYSIGMMLHIHLPNLIVELVVYHLITAMILGLLIEMDVIKLVKLVLDMIMANVKLVKLDLFLVMDFAIVQLENILINLHHLQHLDNV